MNIISKLIKVSSSLFIFIFFFWLFFQFKDITSKLMFFPFLICGSLAFWHSITEGFGSIKLGEFLYKLYVIVFLTFWFGMIGFGLYTSMINKDCGMIMFMIPFILAGVYVVKKTFISK